jgi:hypothetical protein
VAGRAGLDRPARCLDPPRLTASSFVSMDALLVPATFVSMDALLVPRRLRTRGLALRPQQPGPGNRRPSGRSEDRPNFARCRDICRRAAAALARKLRRSRSGSPRGHMALQALIMGVLVRRRTCRKSAARRTQPLAVSIQSTRKTFRVPASR